MNLTFTVIFNCLIYFGQTLKFTKPKICQANLQTIENNAISNLSLVTIPFGRPYAALHFGVAFYIHNHFRFNQVHHASSINGQVSICAINSSVTIEQMRGACNITLLSRLIGPEIIVSNNRSSTMVNDGLICVWNIDFNNVTVPGNYEIELLTWWINDLVWKNGDMSSRMNAGSLLHLCGIGTFYGHNIYPEALEILKTLKGLVFKTKPEKVVYLFIDGSIHLLQDMNTYIHILRQIGLNENDVIEIDNYKIESFTRGADITCHNNPFNGAKINIPLQNYHNLKRILSLQVIWSYGTMSSLKNCTLYGFPLEINVTTEDLSLSLSTQAKSGAANTSSQYGIHTTYTTQQQNNHQASLPLCVTGASPGRWVRNLECDSYPQLSSSLLNLTNAGSECTHSIRAPVGPRSMVWRPYSCRLAHHSTCPAPDTSCIQATGLTKNDFDKDTGHYSAVTRCIREKGIGFIAGFGDSLGGELWKYMRLLFGLDPLNSIDGQRHYRTDSHSRLVCGGGHHLENSFNLLRKDRDRDRDRDFIAVSSGSENNITVSEMVLRGFGLLNCIRSSVKVMIKKQEDENITVNPIIGRTVVVVTNFYLNHLGLGKDSREEIANLLQQQGKRHGELAKSLLEKHNITYRRILMSMTAKQGFRFVGSTPLRAETLSGLAREVLVGQHGWEYLDVYNISYPRPDASWDGMHYGTGAVMAAISDVLMTMICR